MPKHINRAIVDKMFSRDIQMKYLRHLLVVGVLLASGCNLYTELDRPDGLIDAGDLPDADGNDMNASTDTGAEEDTSFTDADFMGDERWRSIDIEIGAEATRPIPWRVTIPDGIATANFGPGGSWLRVFDEEGTPVARKIESWTTGAHIFWVSVDPSVATTRRFWIQYGIEPGDPSPNDQIVWTDGGYTNVWGFASDPGSDAPAWVGGKAASPIEGNGTIAIGGGRVATCVTGLDGWNVSSGPEFGIERGSDGKTFEAIYRGDPNGSDGHILSTEANCNGIGIIVGGTSLIGRLHAGLNCDAGFDSEQVVVSRPSSDTNAFTHVALSVEPIMQGYQTRVFVNGIELGDTRVTTQNPIDGNRLEIGAYLGNEEHSVCIDQVHIRPTALTAPDMFASFLGSVGDNVSIGAERPFADFASVQ